MSPSDDAVSSSRPTGTMKIILLSVVALIGFYLAITQDSGRLVYLILGVLMALLALLLVLVGRRVRPGPSEPPDS